MSKLPFTRPEKRSQKGTPAELAGGRSRRKSVSPEPARQSLQPVSVQTTEKASAGRLQATVHQAAVGIVRSTADGRLLEVNQRICDMLGYARLELLSMSTGQLTHTDDRDRQDAFRLELLTGRRDSFSLEQRCLRKDGRTIWVSRTVSLARETPGGRPYLIQTFEDITERKETDERYRATVDNAPIGIMHTGLVDDRILHANAKLSEMLGYTREELLGMTTDNIIYPGHVGVERSKYREKMLMGELDSYSSERLYMRKDGSKLWVNRTVSLARDAAGKPLCFIRIIEDISERKRAEEAVARERALLGTIIDTMPDFVYVKDADGRFRLANKAWLRERNLDGKPVAGKTVFDVFSRDQAEKMAAQDAAVVRTGIPILDMEQRVTLKPADGKPGRTQWTTITKVPMRDASGNIIGTVGISRDISERKLAANRQAMEHSVTRVLAESSTVAEAMEKIIRTTCESLGYACGLYWEWGGDTELLRVANTWHIDAPEVAAFVALAAQTANEAPAWRGEAPRTRTGGLVRRVWMEGAPVWFPDVTQEPGFRRGQSAAQAGLHCAFGFPILAGSRPLGVMEFFGRDVKQPDEALLQIVYAIGSQIGLFIQRKEAEQALRSSEERYRDVFEASPLPMWIWDDETLDLIAVNQAAVELYGYTRDEFLRMNVRDIWASGDEMRYEADMRNRAGEQRLLLSRKHRTRDGRLMDVEATARRFTLGGRTAWLTLINDVTERKRAEAALLESEEQFRQLAGNIPQVFWITDVTQREALYISPAVENLLGWPMQLVRARPRLLIGAVHKEDRRRVQDGRKFAREGGYDETYRIVRPDGSMRWVRDRAFPVYDAAGAVYRIAGITEDITDRKEAEERLMHLAHYDVLTSLPNRVLFYDRLKQALAQAKRNQWVTAVMFIDVDRFKNVNDTLGHAVGDRLLQLVSERLIHSVRTGDTVGRLGGDEFAIVLSNLANAQDVNLVAQKIMASFKEPFKLESAEIYVTASIGITLYPDDSTEQDTLIKNADAAMYRAKEVGRNSYQFYTPEMNARALAILSMESSMRRALDRNEFLLYYQPKASIADGKIVGVEALLRWHHPERGLVSPGEFMPVLEETGLIVPVGEWVLKAVCRQIKEWESAGIQPVPVAVNLSARQFCARDLGETIKQIIEEHQVDPALLELEITESSLMVNTDEAARTFEFLENLGLGFSVDDFGTGYSSLGYLKRFPLVALKIDSSFVRDIITDSDDATITRALISMAHSLGLKVIAEGVETEPQLAFLAEYGCDEIQGYYFSRPLAADECARCLREGHRLQRPALAADSAPAVLLVDNSDDDLVLLKRCLAKDGYRLLAARNAHEALELLGKQRVDVVISGQTMPGVHGAEFLRWVKQLSPGTMRMMTSTQSDLQTMTDAVNSGEIFRFLPKGMKEEQLRADVREALRVRSGTTTGIGHYAGQRVTGRHTDRPGE